MNSRYEILNQLGEGGEATVWKAWDTKLLPPSQREAPDAGDIFAEASALSALQHPNIVSVYDVEQDEESGPYVVMEFLNGENLEQTVQRGGLTPDDFISITNQVLEGLVAAHKLGMQHRDIKPSNIMLTWLPDQRFIAKLLDFGLAKFSTRPTQQTVKGNNKILGSIYFMAPEQFSHRPLDYRSDLYSLGCVLYYSISTRYPFAGETPAQVMQSHLDHMVSPLRDIRPDIPPILCDWIMWLMRRQPEHRPRDAAQAMEVFRGLVSGQLAELPQGSTGLRTTTVMATKKVFQPQPSPAKAGAVSTSKTQASQTGSSKRPGWLIPVAAVIVIGGSAAAVAFKKKPEPQEMAPSVSPPASAAVKPEPAKATRPIPVVTKWPTAPPVTLGLTLWLDAQSGILDAKGEPVATGKEISAWLDLEEKLGAATDFRTPAELSPDKKSQAPVLTKFMNQNGLIGDQRAVSFKGYSSMLAEQRDGAPKLFAGQMDGIQLSMFVVMRHDPSWQTTSRVVSAKCGVQPKAWDLVTDKTKIRAGTRKTDGKNDKGEIGIPVPGEFFIAQFIRDGAINWAKLYITNAKGETTISNPFPAKDNLGPLNALRLGCLSEFKDPADADYFKGDIALVLIYNRKLGDPDRDAVIDYLLKRFMIK